MPRLGVLTSHPIQYQAPLFRALAMRLDLEVFFAHRQTAEQQAQAGFGTAFDWDVDLLSGYPHVFLANRARRPGVDRFLGCDTPEIAERIASGRFDAFLVSGWHLRSYWQALRACQRRGVPVMVRGDSHLGTPRSLAKRLLKEGLYRWLMRQFDGFLYVGARNREYLLHYGADPARLFFTPHFVDNAWFAGHARAAAIRRTSLRAALGLADREHVVLFVGKLDPWKRPRDLLVAVTTLQASGMPLILIIVGTGAQQRELEQEAALLGARVHFAGFKNQSELPAWYDLADLLVLPSSGETWGLVVNEAMACGTPTVVSDTVGCRHDLIEEGRTGACYSMGNTQELASAISRMLGRKSDPHVQAALMTKAATYSVEAAADGVCKAIAWAVKRTP